MCKAHALAYERAIETDASPLPPQQPCREKKGVGSGGKPSPAAMGVTITDLAFMHAIAMEGEKDKAARQEIKAKMVSLRLSSFLSLSLSVSLYHSFFLSFFLSFLPTSFLFLSFFLSFFSLSLLVLCHGLVSWSCVLVLCLGPFSFYSLFLFLFSFFLPYISGCVLWGQ